ncbi:unnamed protein product, partial [Rotaria magnacalcarata]
PGTRPGSVVSGQATDSPGLVVTDQAPGQVRPENSGLLASLEQTLTQIRTVGDAELMRAHRYYELLYATKPDEIIAVIEEHRSEYTEHDYIYLLQLKHLSFPASESVNFDLNKYEQMIKKALHPNRVLNREKNKGKNNFLIFFFLYY